MASTLENPRSRRTAPSSTALACHCAGSIAVNEGFARPGQRIIITAGVPFGTPGATNMLRIAFVGKNGGR